MKELMQNTKSNVVVLWAHLDHVKVILKSAAKYGVVDKTWILSESSGRNTWFVSDENMVKGM